MRRWTPCTMRRSWTQNLRDELNRLQALRNAAPEDAAAWIARLTPEMKARIPKEGLPLLTLPSAAWVSQAARAARPPEAR